MPSEERGERKTLSDKMAAISPSTDDKGLRTTPFPVKTYNVTDHGMQVCLCLSCPAHFAPIIPGVMGPKVITLEAEEATYHNEFLCFKVDKRLPYGELGSVDTASCGCCNGFNSNLGVFWPGWGCNTKLNAEIVRELKARMKERGDTGQIKRQEALADQVQELRAIVESNAMQLQEIAKTVGAKQVEVQVMFR